MIAGEADGTGIEKASFLASLGYDYVELPVAEIMELDQLSFDRVVKTLKASGIPCDCCNNFFPRHFRLTGPDTDTGIIMDYVSQAMERAGKLGAKVIAFGSGPAKMVPPGFSLPVALDQLTVLLRKTAAIAESYGITIAIEPLRREECNIINTFSEGCELSDAVGEANIKVLADYFHHAANKDDVSHITTLGGKRLVHVHFARPEGRRFPVEIAEDGGYMAFIGALQSVGYADRVSLEAYAGSPGEEAADVAAGLAFMREHF